jgi:hypothetical protein
MSDVQTQVGSDPQDPQDTLDLKAERVQFEFAAAASAAIEGAQQRWVEDRLRKMPGWSLASGGQAIGRTRSLPSPFGATDYASFILREAARTRQAVQIQLSGRRVVITVLAPSYGQESGGIGREQLDFAASLV